MACSFDVRVCVWVGRCFIVRMRGVSSVGGEWLGGGREGGARRFLGGGGRPRPSFPFDGGGGDGGRGSDGNWRFGECRRGWLDGLFIEAPKL